jgi:hypothetical protein
LGENVTTGAELRFEDDVAAQEVVVGAKAEADAEAVRVVVWRLGR